MSALITPHASALALIRDESVTVEQLARHFGESATFAAGLIDVVTGGIDWRDVWHMDDAMPTAEERADYSRGATLGEHLLATERGEVWTADDPSPALPAEALAVTADDIPF